MAQVTFTCLECGVSVTKRRSPQHEPPRFCSQRCNGAYRSRFAKGTTPNRTFSCGVCGKAVSTYRSPSAADPKFCSLVCLGASQKGHGNPSFSGGKYTDPNGYVQVLFPGHHLADCRGYVYEHRLIAERTLGRPLKQEEVVHHRNEIKSDNSPENLQVLSSQAEHLALHAKEAM